jgi:hypothetical protein
MSDASDHIAERTTGFASNWLWLDGPRIKSLYTWLVQRMEAIGIAPDIVTLDAPGFWGVKYKTFSRVRRRIEQYDFGGRFRGVILTLRGSQWRHDNQSDWITTAKISRNPELPDSRAANYTSWLIVPSGAGITHQEAVSHLKEYAKVAVDRYGYLFFLPQSFMPEYHPLGRSGHEPFTNDEEQQNTGWWSGYKDLIPPPGMLRNVYPVNFLSCQLLDLPVHGTTLEQWIRKNTSRGTLERLTDNVMTWTVPVENIPAIREQLFVAGVLFYFKFFQTWEPDNPWKRDFSGRFKPLDPIPEIFRANYRQLTDCFVVDTPRRRT